MDDIENRKYILRLMEEQIPATERYVCHLISQFYYSKMVRYLNVFPAYKVNREVRLLIAKCQALAKEIEIEAANYQTKSGLGYKACDKMRELMNTLHNTNEDREYYEVELDAALWARVRIKREIKALEYERAVEAGPWC